MCTAVSNVGIIGQGTIWGAYNGYSINSNGYTDMGVG